jgi:hypothetical protein
MYWDCYDENDDDLLTYWNNDELVIQRESEHIFDLIKKFPDLKYNMNYLSIINPYPQIQKYEKFVWLGPQIEPRIDLYGFNPLVGIVRELNTVRMSEQLSSQVDKILKRLAKKSSVGYLSKMQIVHFDYREDFDVPEGFTYSDRTHWSTVGEKVFGKRLVDDPQIQELLK